MSCLGIYTDMGFWDETVRGESGLHWLWQVVETHCTKLGVRIGVMQLEPASHDLTGSAGSFLMSSRGAPKREEGCRAEAPPPPPK